MGRVLALILMMMRGRSAGWQEVGMGLSSREGGERTQVEVVTSGGVGELKVER